MNFTSLFGHTITYWAVSGKDGYGKPSFSTPVALSGRWQDQSTISRGSAGVKEIVFESLAYLPSAVNIGDYLAEGTFTGLNPLLISTAKEVKAISKTKDFSGVDVLYTAFLKEK